MGLKSRKANKGKNYRGWHSGVSMPNVISRQQVRARLRVVLWSQVSGESALRDDHGIIPRKVRRSMVKAKIKNLRRNNERRSRQ